MIKSQNLHFWGISHVRPKGTGFFHDPWHEKNSNICGKNVRFSGYTGSKSIKVARPQEMARDR
jgi:hypothetical protein